MRIKHILLRSCAGLLLCGALACGGSSPSEPEGGYTPGWPQIWTNTADSTNTYQFDPGNDAGKSTGNLTGFEDKNDVTSEFRGTFNNRNFQINIDRDANGTFEFPMTGLWVNDNTIRLTSSEGTITITR